MLTAPSVALVVEGKGVVQRVRKLIGERVPEEASPGTIRREYASDGRRNIVHGSDSPGSAQREIELTAPGIIELSAFFRKPGQLMVHLLNNPLVFVPWNITREEISNYFRVEELLPVHDVEIHFNGTLKKNIKSARLPFKNTDLKVTHNPTTIHIPVIHIEEVVLVELDVEASKK